MGAVHLDEGVFVVMSNAVQWAAGLHKWVEVIMYGVHARGEFEKSAVYFFINAKGHGGVGLGGKLHASSQHLKHTHLVAHLGRLDSVVSPRKAVDLDARKVQWHLEVLPGH